MTIRSALLLVAATLSFTACGDDKGDTDALTTTSASTGAQSTSGATDTPTTGGAPDTTDPTTAATTEVGSTGPDATTTGVVSSTGPDTTTGVEGLSFAADVYPVFNPPVSCDCHTPGSGGLKMGTVADAYMNLVGKAANGAPIARVEPGDHTTSYIWHKLSGTQVDVGGGGSQMPLGGPPLAQATIDLIAQWIDEGALP